ncbi:peptidase C39 family protein [Pseudomonas putida]|uniref:peptidase C39 family protein n=1 Tax=Pseudomonas putida TaxID=303 RepID=UPI0018D99F3A|nr:peptidase C39 family protein [Pseudomonas putida]MBH3462654.1 peptidase C39 family protein [Pseudomonas putida]
MQIEFRLATLEDLPALLALENQCFVSDRLNARSLRWMIAHANASLLVAQRDGQLMGYALLLFHRNTSLARLYSIAIAPAARGEGLGARLLERAERCALEHDRAYLRLEVRVDNPRAIALYERHGYRRFAQVEDYYEDHVSALRYEKRILQRPASEARKVPYYAQTTDFTCGPACLLMAMAALRPQLQPTRQEEVRLWREATTVFMTSGHGGCSPHGLALAAWRRGFRVRLQLSNDGPLFLDGVRQANKKEVMRLVHEDFCMQLQGTDVQLGYGPLDLPSLLAEGGLALVLISNYRLTGSKAPHWVLVTGCNADFVYLHDPDTDHGRHRLALDCQHLPVSHGEFQRMSLFGGRKVRAAVVLFERGITSA